MLAGELTARGDAELPECFPKVVVDGVGAEVELCGDLRIGRAAASRVTCASCAVRS